MGLSPSFFLNCMLLGAGLAMDAFSVSLANGLHEPRMSLRRMCLIAGVYGFFQALMPLIGWFCVRGMVKVFSVLEQFLPWISFLLLCLIGVGMLREGFHGGAVDESPLLSTKTLMLQAVATSIDALSVGFTIADHTWQMALIAALIIAAVTFTLCLGGLAIGKRFGTRLAGKASMLGGCILILIGVEILGKHLLRL